MGRMIRALTLSVVLTLSLTGAAGAHHTPPVKVVTSFTILADMARAVAGEDAEVVSITRPGAEIHGYQPTPGDLVAAEGADLILWNGLNLEAWFAPFLDNLEDAQSVVVSEGVVPIPIAGTDKPNPHGWMSGDNALIYVDNIAAALAGADPAHAERYAARAADYKAAIHAVFDPARAAAQALPEDRRWLVTSEGAFSYLARDLGLRELYLWPVNADAQGTPQQVRRVIDAMRAGGAPAVFSESTVSDRPARRLAAETGASYGGVLYVDSLSGPDGPVPSYLDLLRVTTETILKGLADD